MKKIIGLISFLSLLILAPADVLPWGQATHAYFARVLSGGDPNLPAIYGAVAPDLFNLMNGSPDYEYMLHQTHYQYRKVVRKSLKTDLKAFAFGFAIHNERRGADHTAHRHGRTTKEGYVIGKRDWLAPKLRPDLQAILENAGVPFASVLAGLLAPDLAESFIETAIDLLIKRNEDSSIGPEILQAARERPSSVPDLLVASYGRGFAHHMELTDEEAAELIRGAEAELQELIIRYGEILSLDESEAIAALAEEGASLIEGFLAPVVGQEVDFPPEIIVQFLHLSIEQVEGDYGQEVSATLEYLKRTMARFEHRLMRD